MGAIITAEHQFLKPGAIRHLQTHRVRRAAARTLGESHAIVDGELRRLRIGNNLNPFLARLRQETEIDCLEVHQQGARLHVVDTLRATVEIGGLPGARIKKPLIDHQIAAYLG